MDELLGGSNLSPLVFMKATVAQNDENNSHKFKHPAKEQHRSSKDDSSVPPLTFSFLAFHFWVVRAQPYYPGYLLGSSL